jgi:hypothetical protein
VSGREWLRIASGGAIASVAVTAAALQAVEGIALKAMVGCLDGSACSAKGLAFHAALAIRQVEIGLATM